MEGQKIGASPYIATAEKLVDEVKQYYSDYSFRNVQQDYSRFGPLIPPPKVGPKDRNPAPQIPHRELTLWSAMGFHFAEKHPANGIQDLHEYLQQGVGFTASKIRGEMERILTEVGARRPGTPEAARLAIDQLQQNIGVMRRLATLFASSKTPFDVSKSYGVLVRDRQDTMDPYLWSMARIVGCKQPWSDSDAMKKVLSSKDVKTSVLMAIGMDQIRYHAGYYSVQKMDKIDATEVHILDASAYNDKPQPNTIVPGFDDVLIADLLQKHFTVLGTDNVNVCFPRLMYDRA